MNLVPMDAYVHNSHYTFVSDDIVKEGVECLEETEYQKKKNSYDIICPRNDCINKMK